jgi:putative flippase GtrA
VNALYFLKNIHKKIPTDLGRFIFVGVGAVVIDIISYLFLSGLINYNVAKGISFILGSVFAYLFNNYWTFSVGKVTSINFFKFSLLYSTTFCINIAINGLINNQFNMYYLAFLFATGTSTVANFFGQKFWVFSND